MAESSSGQGIVELRDEFGKTLVDIGLEYPEMVFLDADLHTSTKASQFKERFPDRFYQVGIAEQNLFGIAAGLALEGFIPFPSTFAAFATRRALDQLVISICFANLNVKIPGSYVGIPTSRAGGSHNCIEDTAVMRAIPNLRVADPATPADLAAVMRTAIETPGPVYFRVARLGVAELFPSDHTFRWDRVETLRSGGDVTILSTGIMAHKSLEAADLLARDGIDAEVLHVAAVKPLPEGDILSSLKRTRCAVTVENASVIGGFGSAVTELLAARNPVPVQRIGVYDRFVESGGIEELFTVHRMQPADIASAARRAVGMKGGAS
ncbi:MAG: transketolase family protein [Spirochaetales bacterium]|nr:transketolase family protein [Spirochaetales bacterium]